MYRIDRQALVAALQAQGKIFFASLTDTHSHLFSDAVLTISAAQFAQMQAVIAAAEEVLTAVIPAQADIQPNIKATPPSSDQTSLINALDTRLRGYDEKTKGVFYGYDFHLNADGAHLIEINTNAGGAFLNAVLLESQRGLLGKELSDENLQQSFVAMFRNEWRLARADAPLHCIAIVDESPSSQYLYPEFLLAQAMLQAAGIATLIAAPDELVARDDGLYFGEQKIDLIYNRLTDFSLQQFPRLLAAYQSQQVVFTPNPAHYQRYADKRKLALLTDEHYLRAVSASQASVDALLQGVPQTKIVNAIDAETWWAERKQWFFKPMNGYGSKGAYRGDKITKRVFEDILQSDYVAQRLAMPGECEIHDENGAPQSLKYDVRCYVYDGKIQLVAARLYQGQTTNFRTTGGGFAIVRTVG